MYRRQYIHDLPTWPQFHWSHESTASLLAQVRHAQGRLIGRMEGLGFDLRQEAVLKTLTEDVLKTSEIEGEHLNREQVRSSIARRMGIEIAGLRPADRHTEGIVELMLDATRNHAEPLTTERLFSWHAALFPTGRSGMSRITVGAWRTESAGPMQVVSGPMGRENVHYEAPDAPRLDHEMNLFLNWYNETSDLDLVLKSAIAHLWFVTIHPFEDGNGRIARAIADMTLARSEQSSQRFYSMSTQIRQERSAYYTILEQTQKGTADITGWLVWFLNCLGRAIDGAQELLGAVLRKARFWEAAAPLALNDRHRIVVSRLLDDFEGKLTSSKWAKITKCSQDTALRDISQLVELGVLQRDASGGRSTSYSLADPPFKRPE